jgi:TonB family protein
MNSRVSKILVEEWQPPVVTAGKPSGARRVRKWLMWTGILLVHGFLIWQLAEWSPWSEPRTSANAPIFADLMVGEVTIESGASSKPAPLSQLELPIGEIEPPSLPADAWPSEEESSSAASNEFAPPTLAVKSPDTSAFAVLAGIEPGKSVRVILSVDVTELGEAGEVRVVVGSGNSAADDVAMQYARALRWSPAKVQGRPSKMNIRLPVVLAAKQAG